MQYFRKLFDKAAFLYGSIPKINSKFYFIGHRLCGKGTTLCISQPTLQLLQLVLMTCVQIPCFAMFCDAATTWLLPVCDDVNSPVRTLGNNIVLHLRHLVFEMHVVWRSHHSDLRFVVSVSPRYHVQS